MLRHALLTLLFLSSCARGLAVPRVSDDPDPRAPGWHEQALDVGGVERWFRTYVPRKLDPGAPAVVLLHGGTQSMRKIFAERAGGSRGWLDVAEREGVLLLVPNGVDPDSGDARGDHQNWNDLRPDGPGAERGADDVGFVDALLDWSERTYAHDPARVYATGASNGGLMTYRLLLDLPRRFAGGAAFVANLPQDGARVHAPAVATPLLLVHGTADPLMPWDGGTVGRDRGAVRSAEATRDFWIAANGCDPARATSDELPDRDPGDGCRATRTTYPPAGPGGAPVAFVRVAGGGHAMPSIAHPIPDTRLVRRLIGPVCHDLEGAELAWEFLRSRRRATEPVRVVLLVGQSNMEGKGKIAHLEELARDPANADTYGAWRHGDAWVERDDVWIEFLDRAGPLTVGYGVPGDRFGPELALGQVLGDAWDEPLLLVKIAWGGKSLAEDFRPPGAGGTTGAFYTETVERARAALAGDGTAFPGRPRRLVGLVWFQGWNDRVDDKKNAEYEENLVHLVHDLRRDLGAPDLPVVVGETGQGGPDETHPRAVSLRAAQRAACARLERTRFVPTVDFAAEEPRFDGGYHFSGNAANFYGIGRALGTALLELTR